MWFHWKLQITYFIAYHLFFKMPNLWFPYFLNNIVINDFIARKLYVKQPADCLDVVYMIKERYEWSCFGSSVQHDDLVVSSFLDEDCRYNSVATIILPKSNRPLSHILTKMFSSTRHRTTAASHNMSPKHYALNLMTWAPALSYNSLFKIH